VRLDKVEVEYDGDVAIVRLNDPARLNAVTVASGGYHAKEGVNAFLERRTARFEGVES